MSTGFWNNGRHTESTLAAQISALAQAVTRAAALMESYRPAEAASGR